MSTEANTLDDADRLLREDQAANYLNLAPRTLQDWRLEGKGPAFVKVSHRCVRYRMADLAAWVDENTRRPATPR